MPESTPPTREQLRRWQPDWLVVEEEEWQSELTKVGKPEDLRNLVRLVLAKSKEAETAARARVPRCVGRVVLHQLGHRVAPHLKRLQHFTARSVGRANRPTR